MELIAVFVVTNLISFFVMAFDKKRSMSKKNTRRISEGTLFFMATFFGSVGVYAGMFVFRHKTKKWHFLVGIPMLMVQNASFLTLVYLFNSGIITL